MAGVYRRDGSTKYTAWWRLASGRTKTKTCTADRTQSLRIAMAREAEELAIREGLTDPGDRKRREANLKPVDDHIGDYRLDLLAKGDTPKHARHIASTLRKVLNDATIISIAEIHPDRIQAAIGRLKASGRSARTVNHAIGAVTAFTLWLQRSGRIRDFPEGLRLIPKSHERGDKRRERRALTTEEAARLIEMTAQAGPIGKMSGIDRAVCYRLAIGTGFRAHEIGTLTPEQFDLASDSPTITVLASYSKRGKRSGRDDIQPIRRDLADALRAWVASRPPGEPCFPLPHRTAQMLGADLTRAGIDPIDAKGRVLDFHALRHTYVTHLVNQGINIKTVQVLARHSTITLTMDRYTTVESGDIRDAIEGKTQEKTRTD